MTSPTVSRRARGVRFLLFILTISGSAPAAFAQDAIAQAHLAWTQSDKQVQFDLQVTTQLFGPPPAIGSALSPVLVEFGDGTTLNVSPIVSSASFTGASNIDRAVAHAFFIHTYPGYGPQPLVRATLCCRSQTLSDGNAFSSMKVSTAVTLHDLTLDPAGSPVMSAPPITRCAPAAPCSVAMGGTAHDGGTIAYRLATAAESGLPVPTTGAVDPVTGVFTFTPPPSGGRFQVQVVAQTAATSSAIEFVISSNAAFVSPPSITSPACGTTVVGFVGVPLTFPVTVSGGADTTVFLSGAPSGSQLSSSGSPGSYTFDHTPQLGFGPTVMQLSAVGPGGQSNCLVAFALKVVHLQYVSGVVRDFGKTQPDFNGADGDAGTPIVAATLGTNGKPVFAPATSPATIASPTSFGQWFGAAAPQQVFSFMTSDRDDSTGRVFSYLANPFYPIDGALGGNQQDAHNRFFTYEIHSYISYTPGDAFTFTSSDDMWVFVGGALAVDMGGIHGTSSRVLRMDDVRIDGRGLRQGFRYDLAIFYAHRGSAHAPVFGVQIPPVSLCDVLPGTPLPQVTLSDLGMVGEARMNNGALQLTRVSQPAVTSGAAWTTHDGAPLLLPIGDGFSTDFSFRMTGPAEGFAFVIQTASPGAQGGAGANLGYAPIDHSLAVEFDPSPTSFLNDPPYQHVAVMSLWDQQNSANHQFASHGINIFDPARPLSLNNGQTHTVHIEYRPGPPVAPGKPRFGWINVFVDRDTTSSTTPEANLSRIPVTQAQIDGALLDLILQGGAAYLGFASADGASVSTADVTISNWTFAAVAPDAMGSTIDPPPASLLGTAGATVIESAGVCSMPMIYGNWVSSLTASMSIGTHTVPTTVADLGDGTYTIGYTPDIPGVWTLRPSIADTEVRGSPVGVRVNAETTMVIQPVTAILGQRAILSAQLLRAFDSNPIANAAVTFSIGNLHVTTNTGANGVAEFLTPPLTPDMSAYQAAYAGSVSSFLLPVAAVAAVTTSRVATTLTYTGAAGVPAGGSIAVAALLASPFGPIAGEPVTFTLGALSVTAATDPNGRASATLNGVLGPGGPRALTISYGGTAFNQPATTSAQIHVDLPTMLTYNGATTFIFGSPATVTARLAGAPTEGVANEVLTFTLPDGSVVQATTDASGFASATLPALPPGPTAIVIRFGGDPSASLLPSIRTVTVTVVDGTAPVIAPLIDVTVEAASAAGAVVTFPAPAASDDLEPEPIVTVAPASGSLFALGATTVVVTATDSAGNTSSAQFTVHVQDTTAPQITVPPNIALTATSAAGAIATFSASATDTVDGSVTVSCAPGSGSTFPVGTTAVVCSAADAHGNPATAGFTVTVAPPAGQAPKITTPAQKTEEATGPDGAIVSFNATARVPGEGPVPVICAPASGSLFPVGATPIVCSASSASGASATATFIVTVRDTKPPTLDLPGRQVAEAIGATGAPVSFTAAALDLVDGSVPVVCLPASGSTFPLGRTDVACTATDRAGNSRSGSFAVVVRDTIAPDIVSITPSQAVLPPTGGMTPVQFTVVTADAVDSSPACAVSRVTSNILNVDHNGVPDWQIVGPLSVSLEAATNRNRNRNYVVTIKCTDASGNPSREKTTVVVSNQ